MHRSRYMMIQLAFFACSIPALGEDLDLNARHFEGIVISKGTWTVHLKGNELKIERPGIDTELIVVSPEKEASVRIQTSDIEALKRIIDQSRFWTLRDRYGCTQCFDTGGCRLDVSSGTRKHTVLVLPYLGMSGPDQQDAADIRRFMEVWKMVKKIAGLSGVKDICPNGESLSK
jgi:hypothetical protein